MKKAVKTVLDGMGVLEPAQHLYFNIRTASPSILARELRSRLFSPPDDLPLPPPELIFDVIGCRWAAVYLDSGARIVEDMRGILARNGYEVGDFESVLDFGCGCGRLIRHLHQVLTRLHGSDYNPHLIAWCQQSLGFARFTTNALHPPLPYEGQTFDFIYARSVLTHLTEALQHEWMAELHRVLKPEGLLYVTTHGRPLTSGLSETHKAAFEAGQLVVTFPQVAGENLCSTYESRVFVETELLDGFDLVDFVEGRPSVHLRQDVYLLRKH
ncbi:MAG TPA: class I SAM-dependent methyltransferase [Rhodothermales bacterium]|nr:class I SAM-dependent methyltransferase [Rhodothermales bacterium]